MKYSKQAETISNLIDVAKNLNSVCLLYDTEIQKGEELVKYLIEKNEQKLKPLSQLTAKDAKQIIKSALVCEKNPNLTESTNDYFEFEVAISSFFTTIVLLYKHDFILSTTLEIYPSKATDKARELGYDV